LLLAASAGAQERRATEPGQSERSDSQQKVATRDTFVFHGSSGVLVERVSKNLSKGSEMAL